MTVLGIPVDPGQTVIIAVMAVAAVVCAVILWVTVGPDEEPWPTHDDRQRNQFAQSETPRTNPRGSTTNQRIHQ